MGSAPKPQEQKIPAKSPTRSAGVEAEDIVLGGEENLDTTSTNKGKRALIRPSGFNSNTGLNTGV